MRIYVLFSLLAVAANARPQANITSEDWKPIANAPQNQNLRYTNQLRELSNRSSNFIPIDYITHSAKRRHPTVHNFTRKITNNNASRRKVPVKYKIGNVTSLKEQANKVLSEKDKTILNKFFVSNIDNLNKTTKLNNKATPVKNKNWPDTEIQSVVDLNNYNHYVSTTTPRPKKPIVQNVMTKVGANPVKNKNNEWHQIKMKPVRQTTETNYISAPSSIPINIIQNSNPFPVHFPSDNVHFETLVTLSPDVPLKGTNSLGNPTDPCPVVTVTSNTIYNKELCPDLDIVINNHIQTNTNIFTDSPLVAEEDYGSVDYSGNASDDDAISVEASEDAADEALDAEAAVADEASAADEVGTVSEVGEASIAADPEVLSPEEGLSESVASSGTETEPASSSSQGGNRPQLPNLPQFPQNDNNNNDDDDDTGLLGFLNPFNYPFLALVLIPLAVLLTGSLGLSTFFIPWTVFPTIFLSRKAKQAHLDHDNMPIIRPDGWFWHDRYQTWASINNVNRNQNVEQNRAFVDNSVASYILRLIEEFGKKYNENTNKSWKRRKKN